MINSKIDANVKYITNSLKKDFLNSFSRDTLENLDDVSSCAINARIIAVHQNFAIIHVIK